ncbi:MAG: 50S ribosomal protein L11 methyltransferase [Devosia sp.]
MTTVVVDVRKPSVDIPPHPGNKPTMTLSQISTPLTKDQAYALVDAVMERDDLAFTASAHEDTTNGEWVFEATCEMLPDLLAFEDLAKTTLGGAVDFTITPIDAETNWVAKSLEGLQPVTAGGFYVYGSHTGGTPPAGVIPLHIEAAQAFGTGHHETTTGCLEAIDRALKRSKPKKLLDVGTGTGVLAIALAKRTHLPVIASDIDPIATETTIENARINGVGRLIVAITATGLDHMTITRSAPYDLIVANILAAPLVALAPGMARTAARGATIILSGLLITQAARVTAAYARQGLVLRQRLERGDWATLMLEKL